MGKSTISMVIFNSYVKLPKVLSKSSVYPKMMIYHDLSGIYMVIYC